MKVLVSLFVCIITAAACTHAPKTYGARKFNGRSPANDNYQMDVAYASLNGRFIGFFEQAVQDGSGFPTVTFRILDVQNDVYTFDKTMVDQSDSGSGSAAAFESMRADLVNLAKNKLAQGILKKTALSPVATLSQTKEFGQEDLVKTGSFTANQKNYTFTLTETDGTQVDAGNDAGQAKERFELCTSMGPFKKYSLSLTVNGTTTVVHNDTRIPLSRGCPQAYGVQSVYAKGGHMVLFIRYASLGFEGPDYQFITVPVY